MKRARGRFLVICFIGIGFSACSWLTQEGQEDKLRAEPLSSSAVSGLKQDQGATPLSPLSPSSPDKNSILEITSLNLGPCGEPQAERGVMGRDNGWSLHQSQLNLCTFKTLHFRCKRTFEGERQGAQMIEAIVHGESGALMWQAEIASEEIPSAHAERIYSKTRLEPIIKTRDAHSPCYSFMATRVQRARSFNLVDAREEEFDEANEDEIIFDYSMKLQRFTEREDEDELEIKVRAR